jgi:hypothetical protein
MTTFPNSPRLLKGGLVLIHPDTGAVLRIIALQYNPDTLSRTLQVKGVGAEGGDRSEALRLKGPPVETIKLEAEIDATDQLADADEQTMKLGIHPQLAVLETIVYPTSAQLTANNRLASAGTLEITPMQAPLALFIWSRNRVVPVRLTDFSVTEEAFDPALNPLRAKVSLSLRVLSIDDLGFDHRGSGVFMSHLIVKEQMAARNRGGTFSAFGITGLP